MITTSVLLKELQYWLLVQTIAMSDFSGRTSPARLLGYAMERGAPGSIPIERLYECAYAQVQDIWDAMRDGRTPRRLLTDEWIEYQLR